MLRQPLTPELIFPERGARSNRSATINTPRDDLADLDALANWLDAKFQIPGVGIRFGLDAILGLIPGFGDAITALAALYILAAANRHGVSRVTQARMAGNIAIDWLLGTVPLAGDLFDVAWKANTMNVALLKRHVYSTPIERRRHRQRDWLFLALLVSGLAVVLAGTMALAYFAVVGSMRLIAGH